MKLKTEHFKKAFNTLIDKGQLEEKYKELLETHMAFPNQTATATEIAKKLNYKKYSAINGLYGKLAHRMCDELENLGDFSETKWVSRDEVDWVLIFLNAPFQENKKKETLLSLKKEVVDALRSINYFNIENNQYKVGKIYNRRRDIHEKHGGQNRGGISTPAKVPLIFIFTGESGNQYGYEDYWEDGTFFYTGEGQTGDMEFKAGNKAIKDHSRNGEKILLFEKLGKSKGYKYLGEFTYISHQIIVGPDKNGNSRNIIRFQLNPLVTEEEYNTSIKDNLKGPLDTKGQVKIRKEQRFLRDNLFKDRKEYKCGICDRLFPTDLLVAAHIKKRSECTEKERRDYHNIVMSMCKFGCDDLYEKGYIGVVEGKIQINTSLYLTQDIQKTVENLQEKLCKSWNDSNKSYFEWHVRKYGIQNPNL